MSDPFVSSDASRVEFARTDLQKAIRSGDRRESLVAIRDYLAHELEGSRCKTCAMSQLRTGDTAALVLRLTKVMEEIAEIPPETGGVSPLDELRARRDRTSAPPAVPSAGLGTKHAPRQQGGRHPSGTREPR